MSINQSFEKTLETLLLDAGLSEKESRIYRVLLEKGTLKPAEIITLSGLKKGIAYTILYKLAKEELIFQFEKDKKLMFQVADPEKLHGLVERRRKAIEDVSTRIDDALPQLRSLYKLSVGKPTVKYYEGVEGVKGVFADIYAKRGEGKIVWGCCDLEEVDKAIPLHLMKDIVPKRTRNKVFSMGLFTDNRTGQKFKERDAHQYRKSHLVPSQEYPLPAEIDVYEDKIALLSFKKGEFIGMIIQNEDFATTLKSVFKLVFGKFPQAVQVKEKTEGKT